MDIVDAPPESKQSSKLFGSKSLFLIGLVLLFSGGALLLFLLLPALEQEFQYWNKTKASSQLPFIKSGEVATGVGKGDSVQPIDTEFGIVIEKIGANAKVLPEINWQEPAVYQEALRYGVAHAKGTALPGEVGNVFIFAHSGIDFSEAARYNAVFYLMNKLAAGDEIELFYEGKEYQYQVTDTKKVSSEAVEYLAQDESKKTLTLMTCWPAGTTLKRLIVQAELKSL